MHSSYNHAVKIMSKHQPFRPILRQWMLDIEILAYSHSYL
jgi:hypothetical protein